nr:uncharacterized protein LOC117221782 [Megalopta genalis]XP_033328878.1 uncharacterized protein LOC117221782 [Megalopta genalis]XP_033328879.1 uncharacterized protein LOC117221782 [Megalopta genalis]
MKQEQHIDDAQPASVEEHFKMIMEDRSTIDPEYVEVTPKDLPFWFDEKLFRKGQEFYVKNLLAFGVASFTGLISILCVPDIIEVLNYTKKSETHLSSFKRYSATLLLMYELYSSDMLKPDSKWFKAVNAVRWRHAIVSKRRVEQGLNSIYQKDMAITQFGFLGFSLIAPHRVGLGHCTHEQQAGFNHLWRVTGHLLDISDRMNIARRNVAETTELCRRIAADVLNKRIQNSSPDFVKLASNAINGFWYVDFNLDADAFFELTYSLANAQNPKPLGWYSTYNYKQREWSLYLCSAPYIGVVIRTWFNYFLMAVYWMLQNYPILAWMKFGKKESQFCVYPKIK